MSAAKVIRWQAALIKMPETPPIAVPIPGQIKLPTAAPVLAPAVAAA